MKPGPELLLRLPGPSIPDLMAKRSLRGPIALLFLIAVATVVSCRTAVRRSMSLATDEPAAAHAASLRILPATVPWNATLARMAAVDPYEAEARREVEDLLDVAGAGQGREFTHRSIASWRRSHHLERRRASVLDGSRAVAVKLHRQGRMSMLPEFRRALRDWSRNRWRFQPSIMSELVSLIKSPVESHRKGGSTTTITTSNSKYASCAVVGNSGILLQREHGALIDSHQFVIRLNNARIAGYAAHVGTRTDLSFVNSNILHLCARRSTCPCSPYGNAVPMAMYICQPVHFLDYALCNGSSTSSRLILVTDPRFDAMCSRIVKYYSLKRFVDDTGKPPQEWGKVKDDRMFHYSSGMQAVLLAAGMCDRVSLFGFGKAQGAKHHYHTNQKKELDLHDYRAEYDFYSDLANRPQGIPFLADSGFKTPPVVVYH